ncbi:hypothetical protein C7402_109295 [Paraburkholderia unamae]|uniref:Uncharacterized protein n=1 Tax=Paraburkholderia unamae TaxID=219649 RepID=A0ABX5KNI0_9BURK|nr:hypothetical protein C7402_109295 [Paraburkholderia unamae]
MVLGENAEPSLYAVVELLNLRAGSLQAATHFEQERLATDIESFACLGRHDPPGRPFYQFDSEVLLKP